MLPFWSLVLATFLWLLVTYSQKNYWLFIWRLNGWRGIASQPILWILLLVNLHPNSVLKVIKKYRKYFPRPLAILAINRILMYVDDPITMESVLTAPECLNKSFLHNSFFARNGILHAEDEAWRKRRKQLNPAFSHQVLQQYLNCFNKIADKTLNELEIMRNKDRKVIFSYNELENLISRSILELSCLTIMGTETNFTQQDSENITRHYKELIEVTALKTVKPWLQSDRVFRFLNKSIFETAMRNNKMVAEFVLQMVKNLHNNWQNKRNDDEKTKGMDAGDTADIGDSKGADNMNMDKDTYKMNKNDKSKVNNIENTSTMSSDINRKRGRIFIEQLLQLTELGELTFEDIINESQSMVMVSFETASNSVMLALLCLAIKREYQMKLRDEIKQILDEIKSNNVEENVNVDEQETHVNISVDHLHRMPYLDMIINESLRLLPTIPMNVRCVSQDFQLRHSNSAIVRSSEQLTVPQTIIVPRGTLIALDILNMQRDQDQWGPEASHFQPEIHFGPDLKSYSNGEYRRRHSYAYIPFSKGLRTCIGSRYSIYVMKIFLIKLLSKFDFKTEICFEDLQFIEGISLKLAKARQIYFEVNAIS